MGRVFESLARGSLGKSALDRRQRRLQSDRPVTRGLTTKVHALVDDGDLPLRPALHPPGARVTAARQLLDQTVASSAVLTDNI
jgi:hypothetical protein